MLRALGFAGFPLLPFPLNRPPLNTPLPPDLRAAIRAQHLERSVQIVPNERALLAVFLDTLTRLDPDVLSGHNICGFDFDVLLTRIALQMVRDDLVVVPKALQCIHCGI